MEDRQRREFYNTQINRYVRNHATNIMARPAPGDAYRNMRVIARAVIYQALKDACDAEEDNREKLRRMTNNPDLKLKHRYFSESQTYGKYEVRVYQSLYGRNITWTSLAPEPVRFFFEDDYIFYADMAGIDVSGEHLLRLFRERKGRHGQIDSIDSIIDGKGA